MSVSLALQTFNIHVSLSDAIDFKTGLKQTFHNPRANGAKRRSGRKPGARVTNLALAIGEVESQHLR